MKNHLGKETSPYLLQHATNPVDWYPWCEEAFEKAKREDKPIFLSIGYSTCHWCHVMAHESFEDEKIAEILNQSFISIKVDKEERPDIDSIYMSACQAMTGRGGWPTTLFLTPEQKPFFAGTYFPKYSVPGHMGLEQLLLAVSQKWKNDRNTLLKSAERVLSFLKDNNKREEKEETLAINLVELAISHYQDSFDAVCGGFGSAPKFPTPHNLLFLLRYYEKSKKEEVLHMVEKTLLQMYRGGMFDHIGGGFSRYSTDRFYLVPHFEKMLYDNALLILSYCKAYEVTNNPLYMDVAEKTASFVLREMKNEEGGFYSAQDADSEGVEGKYYVFEPNEILEILGPEEGKIFNQYFDITEKGNFEGKSIPNLLGSEIDGSWCKESLSVLYEYRKKRYSLHLDDKVLTSWNALMIAGMCHLYRVTGKKEYLEAAKNSQSFIEKYLRDNHTLFVSYREGKCSGKGYLEDYANEIFALLMLYEASLDKKYLKRAEEFCERVIDDFYDTSCGGFFLYGKDNEQLILRPKEIYDGALPSGNSVMTYNLVRLFLITGKKKYEALAKEQVKFIGKEAIKHPMAHAMFLYGFLDSGEMPDRITMVVKEQKDMEDLSCRIPLSTVICMEEEESADYPLLNQKTTFYVCKGKTCQPPSNELNME